MDEFAAVVCPACFQSFSVAVPPPEELPAEFDYDCEICCRPMVVSVDLDGDGEPVAVARSLDD